MKNSQGIPVPKTSWIQDYVNPEIAPNHPGKDGGSVADPVGNCVRCGDPLHHEDIDSHRMTNHLGISPNYGIHYQMHNRRS